MGFPQLIGLAAAAAGTGMQMAASHDETSGMQRAVENELRRQGKFSATAQQAVMKNVGDNTSANTAKVADTAKAAAMADYAKDSSLGASVPSMAPEDSAYVAPSSGQQDANQKMLEAAAVLRGWKAVTLGQGLGNTRTSSVLGQQENFAQGSQRVLPLEIRAAQNSAETLRSIGKLVQMLGSSSAMSGSGAGAVQEPVAPGLAYNSPNQYYMNQYTIKQPSTGYVGGL